VILKYFEKAFKGHKAILQLNSYCYKIINLSLQIIPVNNKIANFRSPIYYLIFRCC